jgi:hypothetical protein
MRFKMLILLFLFSIAFLAVTALCINWDDPSNNADEMISSGETTTITPPAGQAATPKISREIQANKSSLDWTMPSTLSGNSDSAKISRAEAQSASETTAPSTTTGAATTATDNTTATTDTELPPVQTEAITAEGNWYFTLNDTVVRELAMALFQKGNDVYGAGKIKEGNSTLDVAVSGTIANSTMELNLVSTNPIVQYKLNLDLGLDWAAGEYQASSAAGDSWTGAAEGQKT